MSDVDEFEGSNGGFHVYGRSGALKFEAGLSASKEPVLVVDGCLRGPQTYDWGNKVVLNLSYRELPGFLSCVLGITVEYEAKHHGAQKNKSIHLVNQPDHQRIFVKISRPDYAVMVPMTPDAVFRLGALSLKVLSEQTGFDPATCLAVLRGTAGRLYSRPSTAGFA